VKLLLDENLPHQIRLELPGHEVFTAAYMKWGGVEKVNCSAWPPPPGSMP
jgi:hypothetical protein